MPIEKNTHIVVDNSLIIYQRERTSVWQCKYLLKGKWYRCSTREHDMTAAIRSANMILMEAHMRERFHVVPTSRLFRDVAKLAINMPEFGCLIITAVAIVIPCFRKLNFSRDYEK